MSEVKTMSSIQFPNTEQPYQVNDARIPADPGAYKYMATDGEGNWVAEDRLAYYVVEQKTIAEEQTVVISSAGGYQQITGSGFFTPGGTYYVTFDGTTYECVAWVGSGDADNAVFVGNGDIYGGAGNGKGEPFSIDSYSNGLIYLNTAEAGRYTVRIVGPSATPQPFSEDFLPVRSQKYASVYTDFIGLDQITEDEVHSNDVINYYCFWWDNDYLRYVTGSDTEVTLMSVRSGLLKTYSVNGGYITAKQWKKLSRNQLHM